MRAHERLAQTLIWAFFLLVFSKILEMTSQRLGSPVRPILVYALVSLASAALATVAIMRNPKIFAKTEIVYFISFFATAGLMLLFYQGEKPGPNFDLPLIYAADMPSALGYAVWPVMNLLMALSLFTFVRTLNAWSTILLATGGAYAIQIISMQADVIWPALFGSNNGRAAGLATNANIAVVILGSLIACNFPLVRRKPLSRAAIWMTLISIPAVAASNSRMGVIIATTLVVSAITISITSKVPTRIGFRFATGYVLVTLLTFGLTPDSRSWLFPVRSVVATQIASSPPTVTSDPVLAARSHAPATTSDAPSIGAHRNATASMSEAPVNAPMTPDASVDGPAGAPTMTSKPAAVGTPAPVPPVTSDAVSGDAAAVHTNTSKAAPVVLPREQDLGGIKPPSISSRIKTTFKPEADESFNERLGALQAFWDIAKIQPLTGYGTGFSNKFQVGPHNMWLKLWVDDGILVVFLFAVLFLAMAYLAVARRSPALLLITIVGGIASMLSHTTFIEPQVFVLFAAALGSTASAHSISSRA